MKQIVINYGAAGLAANQVGLPYSIYVTANEVFINPVIQKYFGGYSVASEGCLSFPGMSLDIARSKKVTINAFDENGNEIKTVLTGMASRIAQHECDHLRAMMFFNRLPYDELVNTGLLSTLDSIQNVYMESVESGEVDLKKIQDDLIQLKLERTAWKEPSKSTTVGG